MSDKNDNSKEFVILTPENVKHYQTKEFENAISFAGDEDSFKPLKMNSDSENSGFMPMVEGQKPPEEELSELEESNDNEDVEEEEETEDSLREKIDALSIVVEQEKKEAFEKGLEEGKIKGEEEYKKKFESEMAREMEEAKNKGFTEGFEEGKRLGHDEAFEQGHKEFADKLEMLSSIMESMNNSWHLVLEKYEEVITELSLSIAKKVLFANLTLDQGFVKLSIREALRDIPDPMDVSIGVNPDDYNVIEMIKEDFFQHFENLKNITISPDPTIGRGGCRIDSETGSITQTVETRLKFLEDELIQKSRKTG